MTKSEQRRLTNWRLKVLQTAGSAGNVARTCRHFAISGKTFYKWRQRYHEHGEDDDDRPHEGVHSVPYRDEIHFHGGVSFLLRLFC